MPHRKRADFGSIDTMVPRAKYRIRYWGDMRDGKGYRRISETVYGPRRKASELLAVRRTQHADDEYKPTLRDVYERWWLPQSMERLASGDLAENSLTLYRSVWSNHIEPAFGDLFVEEIPPADIQKWLKSKSKWIAKNGKSLAADIVDSAIIMGAVPDSNPFRKPYRMPSGESDRTKAIWTLEQIADAMRRMEGTPVEVSAMLCALGSCRVGESCAVRADEVEAYPTNGMTVARVPIRRQLLQSGDITERLKNPQSVRTVCIPEPWSLRLLEICDMRRSDGLIWLSDDRTGVPIPRQRLKKNWNAMFADGRELHGLPRLPMQNLRNSWETFMRWELGVGPDLIDQMMGHTGKSIRIKHYDRPTPDVYADTCAMAHLGYFKIGNFNA